LAATSLKIPDDLKHRLENLASSGHKTLHAFMLEVLSREAERLELRQRFAADAAESEEQAVATGRAFDLGESFDYLSNRIAGKKARRPRARAWRGSK
jgi:predicted transcriptional regulator